MTLLQTIRRRHATFHRNEGGQVLMMVAVFALSLLTVTLSIIPVGQAISGKIQLQNAADSAALTAATWMARGANIQQIINGVHFDFDTYIEFMIGATCDKWIGILAGDTAKCADVKHPDPKACARIIPIIGKDWTEPKKEIKNYIDKQKSVASQLKTIQNTLNTLMPILAFIEANAVAKANGAGNLDAIGSLPLLQKLGIGNLVQQALKIVEQVGQTLGIQLVTTTLNPSLNPLSALKFSYAMEPKNKDYCSTWNCSFNADWKNTCFNCLAPPVVMPLWTSGFSWQDTYFLSTNMNTAITFIVAQDAKQSFILNALFLRDEDVKAGVTNLVPALCAIGSAEVYNDQLYPSGMKNITYQPLIVTVFQWPLQYSRFLLGDIYGGKFKARLCPVQITGINTLTKNLIYH